jgi:hypothetical protein
MESTVPIGCVYFKGIQADKSLVCMAEMKIFVNDDETLQCEEKGSILNKVPKEIENQRCAQYIQVTAIMIFQINLCYDIDRFLRTS